MTDVQTQNTNKDGLALVLLRNAFYRDNYKRAVVVLLVLALINVALLGVVIYSYLNPPEPKYFATNNQYQLIKWHPLSDPVVSDNFVKQWVANAVQQSFSLDYVHWKQQLQRASDNFTSSGWHWFLSAFQKSGDLDTLVKLNMVSSAQVTGAPVIQYQNVLDGTYVWKIQLPLMITYSNPTSDKIIRQPLLVTVIVERVSIQDNPDEIAINEFLPVAAAQ